jgi:hypothetical protein
VVARGSRRGVGECDCLVGTGSFWGDEDVLELCGGNGLQFVNILDGTELYTVKWVNTVNFMLPVLCHSRK